MAMFANENDAATYENSVASSFRWQGLYADETNLGCSGSSETASCRDAAIEEILHLVTASGVSQAYPSKWSECANNNPNLSAMQTQMDIARGGHFETVPATYPLSAIYHYNDQTCNYACMGTEMFYWALTSLLGGQDARAVENSVEWEASTASDLQSKLPGMYNLLAQGNAMKLLSLNGVLPGTGSSIGATGTYNPASQTCPAGCGLDGLSGASACGPLSGDYSKFCPSGGVIPTPTPTPIDQVALFDSDLYLSLYADLSQTFGSDATAAYNHLLSNGLAEGRVFSYVFDSQLYLDLNPDVVAQIGSGGYVSVFDNFVTSGIAQGKVASYVFNPQTYLVNYSDLNAAFGSNFGLALTHFLNNGIAEGRRGSLFFDVAYYLGIYSDLSAVFGTDYKAAMKHYITHGVGEGRSGSSAFDPRCYLARYADLVAAFGSTGYGQALLHFVVRGYGEGRVGSC